MAVRRKGLALALAAAFGLGGAAANVPTQVPVGQLDVQVSVEVDFAIA